MSYIAAWGPKKFVLSPTKIITMESLTTSVELNSDSENDTSGTAPTNTRGLLPRPVTFAVTYSRAAGVDPRTEVEEWENLVGASNPLYIGSKQFGKNSLILKKVESSEFVLSPKGDVLSVFVNITMEAAASGKNSAASGSGTSTSRRTASVYDETVEKRRAMGATATASDRSDRKPSTVKTEVAF